MLSSEADVDGRPLLFNLVRTCVSLADLAGKTIRGVQLARELAASDEALGASLKDPTEPAAT